jgi:hypothetical protein
MRLATSRPWPLYAGLLLIQTVGGAAILAIALPVYRHILTEPGQAVQSAASLWAVAAVLLSQAAYWFRLMRVPMPVLRPRILLSHLVLFASRLVFIFGAALFSVVFFRHLPEFESLPGLPDLAGRAALLFGVLFALFCWAMEWERLGQALKDPQRG